MLILKNNHINNKQIHLLHLINFMNKKSNEYIQEILYVLFNIY